jgi:hypothetical protein
MAAYSKKAAISFVVFQPYKKILYFVTMLTGGEDQSGLSANF